MKITYRTDHIPETEEIIDLYSDSDYFPIQNRDDTTRIKKMHDNADIVATAWHNDTLVGLARAITDFCYCCYLSDVCVRDGYKGNGIGRALLNLTKETAGDECKLILQSSETAIDFYSRIGMERIDSAFIIQRKY